MVHRKKIPLAIAAALFSFPALTHAIAPLPPAARSAPAAIDDLSSRYMFEDRIKPGMKGYGLTVIHGGKIEKFNVEVIDVIKNFSPGQNAILIKCSGLGLEESGIIAGMSGSPVFLPDDGKDKMIGAVAYGWETLKEPIGGVQPIRQMLDIPIPSQKPDAKIQQANAGPSRWSETSTSFLKTIALQRPGWSKLIQSLSGQPQLTCPSEKTATPNPYLGLRPLASPLMVSGATKQSLDYLSTAFSSMNLIPLSSGSAAATADPTDKDQVGGVAQLKPGEIKLEPGSAIAIPILTGDADMSAIGTVTEVRGNRVWAFGHAMFAEGPTSLPISTAYIYSIMPSLMQSFKFGSSYQPAGALIADEQTGIVGQLGKNIVFVPITLTIQNPDKTLNHTFHYQLTPHPQLTAETLGEALTQSVTAQRNLPKEYTAHVTGQLTFDDATLNLDDLSTDEQSKISDVLLPVAVLTDNPFENMKLTGVKLTVDIEPQDHSAEIKSIVLNRNILAPGDEITATVELVPFQAKTYTVQLNLKIPADTPEGDYELTVGSAAMAMLQDQQNFPQRFDPRDAKSLLAAVQHIISYQSDHLYAALALDVSGVAQSGKELSDLPPTRTAMYSSDKRSNVVPLPRVITAEAQAGTPPHVLIEGGDTFKITVDKDANKRFFTPKNQAPAPHLNLPPADDSSHVLNPKPPPEAPPDN